MAKKKTNPVIKIEKGIPMPERRSSYGFEIPFSKMKNGDSFLIKCDVKNKIEVQNIYNDVRFLFSRFCRTLPFERKILQKISMRKVENGVRFWFIEYKRELKKGYK